MRPVRRLRVRRRYRRLSDASNGGAAANESLRKALSAAIGGDGPALGDAGALLTPHRLDIAAKPIYGAHRNLGVKAAWADRLYDQLNLVWNGHFESAPLKTSGADFRSSFNDTLDSIRTHGFDAGLSTVRLGSNGSPINGSHRVAASIVHGATGRWNGTGAVPQTVEDEPQARTMRKTSPSLDSTYSSPAPSKPKEVRPATEPGPNHRSLSFTVRLRVGTKLSIHPPQKSPKK